MTNPNALNDTDTHIAIADWIRETTAKIMAEVDTDARERRLHAYARQFVETLPGITMKLVRWNDIVAVALAFYHKDPKASIRECLLSCVSGDPMFDGKNTLAASLVANYGWMLK